MFATFLITFRETLEAALVVGIVLGYLKKIHELQYRRIVWWGVAAGVGASVIGAWLFYKIAGGFEGRAEKIFEGVTMLVGAALLTTMILWVMKQRKMTEHIKAMVRQHVDEKRSAQLFGLVFVSVLREGIETVIYLNAAWFAAQNQTLGAALIGIFVAIALGYALYMGSLRMNIKKFFTISSILLILFAAGLVAHGIHEMEEAHIFPPIIPHVWDINPLTYADGAFPILHENGYIGSMLKSLFGYNGNPSLLEVLGWIGYVGAVGLIWRKVAR